MAKKSGVKSTVSNKVKLEKEGMSVSPFVMLKYITQLKKKWSTLTDIERKSFTESVYIINRTLSMHTDYTELVNDLQKYTIGNLGGKEVYSLYYEVLPKANIWAPYISFKSTPDDNFNERLITFIASINKWSLNETISNLKFYMQINENYKEELIELLLKYGISEAESKKEYGLK